MNSSISTQYPRWIVLFVPALGSLIITGVYASHVVPVRGNRLYPAVLSLPHLVFFLLSTVVLWRRSVLVTTPVLMRQLN